MGWIKRKVEDLYKKYKTRNPFTIAKFLNIEIVYWDLPLDINGFYQYERRNRFIFINNNLSLEEQLVVCAHELAHALFHKNVNTSFMRQNTFLSVSKIEIEANTFAAHLLISDECLQDYLTEQKTIQDIASLHNLPLELVELKCKKLFL